MERKYDVEPIIWQVLLRLVLLIKPNPPSIMPRQVKVPVAAKLWVVNELEVRLAIVVHFVVDILYAVIDPRVWYKEPLITKANAQEVLDKRLK